MAETEPATVLVADDDELLRELLTMALSIEGYAVLAAADGLEATQLLEAHLLPGAAPCVILLDIMMPRLHGFGVLDYLKARQLAIPVLAMSANSNHLLAALAVGARGILAKPFEMADVLRAVARYCTAATPC